MMEYSVRIGPMDKREVIEDMDRHGRVEGVVEVDFEDVLRHDIECFNDLLSERLVEWGVLGDIAYQVVGHKNSNPTLPLHIKVTGKVIVEDFMDDEVLSIRRSISVYRAADALQGYPKNFLDHSRSVADRIARLIEDLRVTIEDQTDVTWEEFSKRIKWHPVPD